MARHSRSVGDSQESRVPRNARELALDVLTRRTHERGFVNKLFDARAEAVALSGADRRLAMELTYGVVRREATLDALLKSLVKRPQKQVEAELWTLLRLGAYQLAFLPGIPNHAAVHETVELAKRWGVPSWGGFANGVLRSLSRQITDQYVEEPSRRAIPIAGGRYRLLTSDAFPDFDRDPAEYFAAAFSFPRWLVERWQARFSPTQLRQLGFWFDSTPRTCVRVNRLKMTRSAWMARLESSGLTALPGRLDDAVWVADAHRIEDLPGFAEGEITVQDESAMEAALLLAPQPGEQVLDLCAAPGGKTTHLAECMSNRGHVLAVDIRADRLALVDAACARLGIGIVDTQLQSANLERLPEGPFDAILTDVPCSNTGVLGKRADARWRIQPSDLRELPALQLRLARNAAARLRTGGRMVYSTCSIEPEENGDLVRQLLADLPELRLVREIVHRPGEPGDGGYQALIEREG